MAQRDFARGNKVYHRLRYADVTFTISKIDFEERIMKLQVYNDPEDNAELWDDNEWVSFDEFNEDGYDDSDYSKFDIGDYVTSGDYKDVIFEVTDTCVDGTITLSIESDPYNNVDDGWEDSYWMNEYEFELYNEDIKKEKMSRYSEDNDDFEKADRHYKMVNENNSKKSDSSYSSYKSNKNNSVSKTKIKLFKAKGLI